MKPNTYRLILKANDLVLCFFVGIMLPLLNGVLVGHLWDYSKLVAIATFPTVLALGVMLVTLYRDYMERRDKTLDN